MKFRIVESSDKWLLYKWANDEVTRSMSFNTSKISEEDHEKWFVEKMADDTVYLYIVVDDITGKPLGFLRVDQDGVISFSIDQQFRGKGLGSKILIEFIKLIEGSSIKLESSHFKALIKAINRPSVKSFEKAGFILNGTFEHEGEECVEYEYSINSNHSQE
ncbi:GNAT family N-acetyltransferase [Paenibacillus illinoisensis]|uniref:GNAT family N-acetyltransferase n=1 Tax=Paenibacillus illinoisensis TaxID=59845 RepID=UPI001C8D031B|nr:GNAT family N-acetyltransferase [Paenibacillus illinoisensis]MBY0220427.1 GNAT family N-acetyltransferase [Paenibacillus illinoisensis]